MWNNIAKSAEAVFSRWAVKRLCKFLLKKKLGQFILGDIDLDQLDVQLRAGTIHLSDLALNVDFLNHKLGAGAAFVVKEGSIGSLSVTMPWKDRGCEIEVEELELVLAPPGFLGDHSGLETCIPSQVGDSCGSGKTVSGNMDNTVMPVSSDVHEGVKTIAKMVKWLLTSFHVKVKKLIVALDSSIEEHEKSTGSGRTLVLRMSEVQCGTCISEEASSEADAPADNLLGLNMLTNFVKFEGATLEFLEMDGLGSETVVTCVSGTTFGECFSESCPSNGRTPVITGKDGGFSGTLKLRIPWKNGSLNIRKVDADAHIDPLVLRFQPSSIKWLLHFWQIVKDPGKSTMDHVDSKTAGSIHLTTASPSSLSTLNSCVTSNNKVMPGSEKFSFDFSSSVGKEKLSDALLPESQLISDWVPFSPSKNVKNGVEEEPDFGASVEQFFDCLDEMRNSQSALGNSGMWNWTCSVFTAITAASNLASGSIHIPPEPQHIETTLKTNFAGISVVFSLLDSEDQKSLSDLSGDKTNTCSVVHYLTAAFQEIVLVLQVSPQQIKFKATVENIELTDNFSEDNGGPGTIGGDKQGVMIHQVQAAIHDTLPPFARGSRSDKPNQSVAVGSPFARTCTDRGSSRTNCDQINPNNKIKILLLKTSGRTDFQVAVNSRSTGYHFTGASSFSLQLPPVVFWVNFHLINMVLVRLQEFANFFEADSKSDMSVSEGSQIKGGSSSHGDTKRNGRRYLTALSTEERLRGNIFLPNARIILCFTSENDADSSAYCSWSEFIALDVSSPSKVSEENVQVSSPVSILDSQKRYSSKTSHSIHLNMGNLDIYLITSPPNCNFGSNPDGDLRQKFSCENILSATNRRGDLSVISMIWQEAPGTGPLIARSAKQLATSEDIRGRSRFVGKGYEFASVTTAKDTEELSYRARQEIILSSAFILHIHLSPITIKLSSHQYKILHRLSQQAIERLSCLVRDSISVENDSSDVQKSIIVECGSVDISVSLEPEESTKGSIQNELPGSWQSLRLQMKKIHLLTVSNIGGLCGSDFLWFSHAEGSLWGSVTEVPNQEFPLVSCSNSTMGRGDGEGSNILFSQFAGSDIIHLWDPETCHVYMSITIRCCTIIAMGGRLDWFEAISGFFSLPSPESEQVVDTDLEYSVDNVPTDFSLVLNLVDIGLSYEPYLNGQITSKSCESNLRSTNVNEGIHKNYVACLLAASSLNLSNNKLKDHVESDYRVKVQDLGLLLCAVPRPEDSGGAYGAERLHNVGYVKIAKEAHLEAILRMNCGNGLLWELECSKSNIFLETCHDTTSGLIDLVTQLQQLFAPDMEESAVHLQARWNDVQKAQESDVIEILNNDHGPSTSSDLEILETKSKGDVINLMEEICEDAFHLREHLDGPSVFREPELCDSDNGLVDKEFNSTAKSSEHKLSMVDSEHRGILESVGPSQKSFPELIEGYFLSELCSLPAASKEKQWQDEVTKHKSRTLPNGDAEKVNNGWYAESSFKILEDHVSDVSSHFRPQQLVPEETTTSNHKEPDGNGKVRGRVVLKNINVHWRMYAGSDWHKFQRRDKESPDMLGRDRTSCLEFTLSKISCQYEVYPEGGICASRLKLAIQEFHLSDNSADSPWKMVLGYYQSKDRPRSSSSKAFKLDLEAVRPDPSTPLEEYRLRVAMLPMVLHLHQSQLDFFISFFGGKSSSLDQSPNCYQDLGEPEVSSRNSNFGRYSVSEEALLPFFQKFDLWPVLIRVDYVPCRVDLAALRGGKYVELINLVPWKGVELQLKHVHAVGLYGWGSVCETVLGEWLEDISQNQIHKLLRGLPPIRSLVAVGSGAAKLVSLPVKNYKKDRRLLKGMQRGTIAFLRSISLEAVGLGVHLAAGAHDILLQAEYILTSVPPSMPLSPQTRTKTNVRSNQPNNVRQGVQQAYESMSDGLGKTASALVRAPLKSYQRGAGAGSAFATAVKAVPGAAMSPASAAARAVHCTLLGVRNSLDPEHKKESIEKYLGASHPRDNMRSRNHDSVDRL